MRLWVLLVFLAAIVCFEAADGALKKKALPPRPSPKGKARTAKGNTGAGNLVPFSETPDAKKFSAKELQSFVTLEGHSLFMKASEECAKSNFLKCYAMFYTFAERNPTFSEGLTNAGVALENMQRTEEALDMYKLAMQKFGSNANELPKITAHIATILQNKATMLYASDKFEEALESYQEIIKIIPAHHLPDAYINIGNIQERLLRFDDAAQSYIDSFDASNKTSLKALNLICRLKLMAVGGSLNGRFDVTQAQKLEAFESAKHYCSLAAQLHPDDPTANMNMGMLFKEGLQFDEAIRWMERAHQKDSNDLVIMSNLAATYSRNDMIEKAVKLNRRILEINPTSGGFHSLGVYLAPFDRKSKEGINALLKAAEMHLSSVPAPINEQQQQQQQQQCKSWVFRHDWMTAMNATVVVVLPADPKKYFGQPEARILEGHVDDTPLLFVDKQVVAITIDDVFVGGSSAVPYSKCEVYPTTGINTDLAKDFSGSEKKTVFFDEEVIDLIGAKWENYYHWLAEGMSRVLLSYDYFVTQKHAPNARIILPSKTYAPHVWDAIKKLKLNFGNGKEPLEYLPTEGQRLKFRKLHLIDWVQLNKQDPDQNDMWSMYLPPCAGLLRTRDLFRNQYEIKPFLKHSPAVIYVSRTGVREVLNEIILVDALTDLLGEENFYVFGMPSRMSTVLSFDDQVSVFKNAKIILGPHGAGLTNQVFLPPDATVIEFAMKPHCNRCFGYMAMCLDIDYWLVPQISTNYHLKYQMTTSKAREVVKVVRQVIRNKHLQHLIKDHEEL